MATARKSLRIELGFTDFCLGMIATSLLYGVVYAGMLYLARDLVPSTYSAPEHAR